jgi:hypothetical protein
VTLAQLRTALRTRLGVPTGDPLLTDTNATDLVNSALHMLETEHDWPWLETSEDLATVIGTATVTPGATWMRTINLRISNGVSLSRRPVEEVDFMASAGTGEPRLYAVTGATITLFPTPSAVLTLKHRFVRSEPDLAADGDTPLVPASFRPAIVEYAAHLAYRRMRDEAKAAVALAAYGDWLKQMRARASRYADTHGGGAEAPAKP